MFLSGDSSFPSKMFFPRILTSCRMESARNRIEPSRAPPLKASSVGISETYFPTAMLRIRRVSGEELTPALEENLLPDVRALKRRLNQLYGLPPRFRQRLLLHGKCLEDTATLDSAMELELVVLAFIANPSSDEVQEFTAAACAGHFDKARALSKAQFCTPHSEQII